MHVSDFWRSKSIISERGNFAQKGKEKEKHANSREACCAVQSHRSYRCDISACQDLPLARNSPLQHQPKLCIAQTNLFPGPRAFIKQGLAKHSSSSPNALVMTFFCIRDDQPIKLAKRPWASQAPATLPRLWC